MWNRERKLRIYLQMYKKLTIICANSHFNVVFLTEIIILFVHLQACWTLLFCIGNALVTNSYSNFFSIPMSQIATLVKTIASKQGTGLETSLLFHQSGLETTLAFHESG